MFIGLTLLLLVFWLAIAYREYQRGDMVLAGIFLLVGVGLTIYRIRLAQRRSQMLRARDSQDSNPPDPPPQNPIGQ